MKRVLMLAGDYTEDYEVMVPYQALLMAGWRWMWSARTRLRETP
mgnify:CR=1 FL=1